MNQGNLREGENPTTKILLLMQGKGPERYERRQIDSQQTKQADEGRKVLQMQEHQTPG
jgi:hypothetical protein